MPSPARLHADHLHGFVLEERIEQAHRIGAAADAGDEQVGQALFLFQDLPAGFVADDALEIAHHQRIGMRAIDRAEDVMRGADVGDPVAHGFVDGFLERLLAGVDGHDLRAEHFHAINIERLPLAIHRAHVDDALQPEHRRDGGGGDAVLPAPVSAMMRVLPMRRASRIWPMQLLILCAPVWSRSSRLR